MVRLLPLVILSVEVPCFVVEAGKIRVLIEVVPAGKLEALKISSVPRRISAGLAVAANAEEGHNSDTGAQVPDADFLEVGSAFVELEDATEDHVEGAWVVHSGDCKLLDLA